MNKIEIRLPNIENLIWEITPNEEYEHPQDCYASGNDDYDEDLIKGIIEDSKWNDWAWCCIKVTGNYKGITASDYLGCCSYHSKEDFMEDKYFKDMQVEIHGQIIRTLENLK